MEMSCKGDLSQRIDRFLGFCALVAARQPSGGRKRALRSCFFEEAASISVPETVTVDSR